MCRKDPLSYYIKNHNYTITDFKFEKFLESKICLLSLPYFTMRLRKQTNKCKIKFNNKIFERDYSYFNPHSTLYFSCDFVGTPFIRWLFRPHRSWLEVSSLLTAQNVIIPIFRLLVRRRYRNWERSVQVLFAN
jgi:hypothetical protein